ncbi:MAG: hypothetical protein V3T23_01755 [Nitrososphaerales archaeon]
MITRKSFLRLIRNRVAAGVLCSGMLTDALENYPLAEVFPSVHTATDANLAYLKWRAEFHKSLNEVWTAQYANIPTKFPGVGIGETVTKFAEEIEEIAKEQLDD